MSKFAVLIQVNLKTILRDRILHAILGAVVVGLLLVPAISSFSMRQVQELAISLALSGISFFLLVMAILLGSSSIWRDVEQRHTTSVLTLPLSRTTYVLAKFAAIAIFLLGTGILLGICSIPLISVAAASYPSDQPILWGNLVVALCGDIAKSMLIAAMALLLSSISTSFYLPFFGSVVLYLCGSASQEVYEYVTGEFVRAMHPLVIVIIKSVYCLLPNLAAFNYKVQAVYALPIPFEQIAWSVGYGTLYVAMILVLAVLTFNRRVLG
ncbi:MAG: ABC transporter permease [Desulfuromonadales bacterium]|nr:ABC transporter permease [Desulfuromonadales bacterium]